MNFITHLTCPTGGRWRALTKNLLVMKLILLFIGIFTFQATATVRAQKLSLTFKNVPLVTVISEIKKQSGYLFWYNDNVLQKAGNITLSVSSADLKTVLDLCLAGQPLSYEIVRNTVVIREKTPSGFDRLKQIFTPPITVTGKVTDEKGTTMPSVNVRLKGTNKMVVTDKDGHFNIEVPDEKAVLQFTFIGYLTLEEPVKNRTNINITLKEDAQNLKQLDVVSTGYQNIPKERATGSFTTVDNKTLNRAASPDLLSRLRGVSNGLLIDRNTGNPTGISIRGRSTLFSNTKPLIVVDNFPFEGDINTLNPNDIESVTLLKDAAAASIWGVRAGNGVMIITTKNGKVGQKPSISFNSNVTIGAKPDLYYQPQLSSGEFIEVEKYLFNAGKYNSPLRNDYALISPVVDILQKQKLNQLTDEQANSQIESFKNIDIRNQQSEYFYRKSTQQQYHVNISGGDNIQTYFFSGGYDKSLPSEVSNSNSRITLKGNNTYNLLNGKLQLTTNITFSKSKSVNTPSIYTPLYPYDQVADANGEPLATLIKNGTRGLRTSYTDTVGNGKLLDWKYRPLEDLRNQNSTAKTDLTDYRILLGVNYKFISPLSISLNYQYYNANRNVVSQYDKQSFYVRNMVNTVTQINRATGDVSRPIPFGDVYSPGFQSTKSNYGRAQVNYNQTFSSNHEINAIAGLEVRDDQIKSNTYTLYGYDPETAINSLVNPITTFPSYYGNGAFGIRLGNNSSQSFSTNRYVSYYGNASYSYSKKYILSGSYRKDESNLFGVEANQKGVPLWSIGTAWNVDNESFFNMNWLSKLQLRATYGYNGNVNQSVSAFLTAYAAGASPLYNANYATITNPPNNALRWERVKNINFGLDFALKNNRISGSIEYYIKNGLDLIAESPIAPQTGVSTFTGNVANTHANGIDLQINSINLKGQFQWNTIGIFNFVKDKVTNYNAQKVTNESIARSLDIVPLINYPINSVFGLRWAGLDNTGAPQGFLNGIPSTNYTSILTSVNTDELDFFGSAVPTVFGSLRNTFSFRNIELSFNISYKFNSYFRRQSLDYNSLFEGSYQQSDYNSRWQKPGDELLTNVPSALYPINPNREGFYRYSSNLVEKGDVIRLQDIQVNYNFSVTKFKSLPFTNLNVYLYANNLGILWRANHYHLDPDVTAGFPVPKTIAFGLNATF